MFSREDAAILILKRYPCGNGFPAVPLKAGWQNTTHTVSANELGAIMRIAGEDGKHLPHATENVTRVFTSNKAWHRHSRSRHP